MRNATGLESPTFEAGVVLEKECAVVSVYKDVQERVGMGGCVGRGRHSCGLSRQRRGVRGCAVPRSTGTLACASHACTPAMWHKCYFTLRASGFSEERGRHLPLTIGPLHLQGSSRQPLRDKDLLRLIESWGWQPSLPIRLHFFNMLSWQYTWQDTMFRIVPPTAASSILGATFNSF